MSRLKPILAQLCVLLVIAPTTYAQDRVNLSEPQLFRNFRTNYQTRYIPPVNLANSGRLDSLLRAGKIYLSLQDAIALALENNLDIELARFAPEVAQVDLMRARAGGLLRGIPTAVRQGPASVQSQVTGGATGGAGGNRGTGTGDDSGSAGGTIITPDWCGNSGSPTPVFLRPIAPDIVRARSRTPSQSVRTRWFLTPRRRASATSSRFSTARR